MATSVLSSFTPQPKPGFTGIKEMLDSGLTDVPEAFILPTHLRDRASQVASECDIPVIDLTDYEGGRRAEIVDQIKRCCEEWGFFQVVNHGVDVEHVLKNAQKFYELPTEEKKRLPASKQDGSDVVFNTGFNLSPGEARDWKDFLALWRRQGLCNGFNHAPEVLREGTLKYVAELDKLAGFIYDAMFESLGLSEEYRKSALPNLGRLVMIYNFYPACPEPKHVQGASPHSDISSLTLLLQGDVAGLQVRKDGKWVPVRPIPNALVVNVSDQVEILTNGKYESVEHRATAPGDRLRMSVAAFYGPSEDSVIAPLPPLCDENNPPKFRPTAFSEYLQVYNEQTAKCYKSTLNYFRA